MQKKQIIQSFTLTKTQLEEQAELVAKQIKDGIQNKPSSFALLPSFLQLPKGFEQGKFLALDFGGSNVRVANISLDKQTIIYEKTVKKSLKELLLNKSNTADELFLQIAFLISSVADEKEMFLGHTFSYPTKQTSVNNAMLKKWTKENFFIGGENVDINNLLYSKLKQIGNENIYPSAILNDTVATLLTGSYCCNTQNAIGSICGTGHNSCYFDPVKQMVINMESGNFSPSCKNQFDALLDSQTMDVGQQHMEKMTAGNYLFKIVNLALQKANEQYYNINNTEELAQIIELNKNNFLTDISKCIVIRAAKLVAAEYFGICQYLFEKNIVIEKVFLDGAVFNKIKLFQTQLKATLLDLMRKQAPELCLVEKASLTGAAIASAIIENKNSS